MPATSFSAILNAVRWISDLLTGTLGMTIAILAVAWVGFAMLQGRLPVREGIRVILGCFLLFGAPIIARGFIAFTQNISPPQPQKTAAAIPSPVPVPSKPPQFDPYAGASVPNQ